MLHRSCVPVAGRPWAPKAKQVQVLAAEQHGRAVLGEKVVQACLRPPIAAVSSGGAQQ